MRRLAAALVAGVTRVAVGATVTWTEEVQAGAAVYFANHSSNLDFLVIWSTLPHDVRNRTRPVAARDYWESSGLRRRLAHGLFRAVLIDRGGLSVSDRDSQFEAMIAVLDAGESLILFPEGTRGPGDRIAEFKSGLYHLGLRKPHVPLVPVHLENLNRILPKGAIFPVPLLGRVAYGPAIRVETEESKSAFLERARHAVEALGR